MRNRFIFFFLLPTLIIYFVFYFYSIVTVLLGSVMKWDYSNLNDPEFFGFVNMFENYRYLIEDYPFFWEAIKNSIMWAVLNIFIQTPLAVITAVVLSKRMPGWQITRNAFIIPDIISSAALGLIFLQLFNPRQGIVNELIQFFNPEFTGNLLLMPGWNLVAITISYIFFTGTFTTILLGQINSIPEEIYEASALDGAVGWKVDLFITIPAIKESIKSIAILSATNGWLLFSNVFFLTNGAAGSKSISYIIRELAVSSSRTQYGRSNAVGVIQILGGLIIIIIINLLFKERKRLKEVQ